MIRTDTPAFARLVPLIAAASLLAVLAMLPAGA
jgi:hypothetical protein